MASFGVVGCVTLSEEGRNVTVVSKENRWVLSEHCTLIGDETITNIDGNNSGLTVFEWENELRNRAAAKGATHLYWEHLPRLNGAISKGYLYRCPDSGETSGLSDSQDK
jgi:hypothetical protein